MQHANTRRGAIAAAAAGASGAAAATAPAVFPRGTIKRVKVNNFMTYSGTVAIQPGPRLNLVLGPNGVCCGGSVLGWGWVEVGRGAAAIHTLAHSQPPTQRHWKVVPGVCAVYRIGRLDQGMRLGSGCGTAAGFCCHQQRELPPQCTPSSHAFPQHDH